MPSLTQPNLKIGWAKKHLDALNKAIQVFSESKPYHISPADDVERNEFMVTISYDAVPSPIGLIAGDFLTCLRSSLDYLSWQLARLTTIKPSRDICFPVCDKDSLDTQLRITKSTYQIPDDAVAIMKSFQPYHDEEAYKLSSLWRLNKLWNIDKHRHLTLHSTMHEMYFVKSVPKPNVESFDNKCVMRFPLSAKDQVNLEPWAPVDVIFGDDNEGIMLPSESFLDMHKFVSETVIPRFAGFFPK